MIPLTQLSTSLLYPPPLPEDAALYAPPQHVLQTLFILQTMFTHVKKYDSLLVSPQLRRQAQGWHDEIFFLKD